MWIKVRIKRTGQVQDLIPEVARAMIAGGTAEEVKEPPDQPLPGRGEAETASVDPRGESAVTSAQKPPKKKAKS